VRLAKSAGFEVRSVDDQLNFVVVTEPCKLGELAGCENDWPAEMISLVWGEAQF
jgi:hypothetical protein